MLLGVKFQFHPDFKNTLCKQTVQNCVVCQCPIKTTLGINGLKTLFMFYHFQKLGVSNEMSGKRMSAERCAHLMVIAMANKLYEAWISPNPELFYCYMFQYIPSIAKRLVFHI